MNTTAKKVLLTAIRLLFIAAILLLAVVSVFFNEKLLGYRESERIRLENEAAAAMAQAKAAEEELLRAQAEILIPQCTAINYYVRGKNSDFSYQNPKSNKCFLKVSITRLDTSETIYASQLISPGSKISDVTFFSGFSYPGVFDAMVKVDAYALGKMSFLNSMVMETKIYVY